MSFKKELIYNNLDQLKLAFAFEIKVSDFSKSAICSLLLEIYSNGIRFFNKSDYENAFGYLNRFFEGYVSLSTCEVYKREKMYIRSRINKNKLKNVLEKLAMMRKELAKGYESKQRTTESTKSIIIKPSQMIIKSCFVDLSNNLKNNKHFPNQLQPSRIIMKQNNG